MFPHVVFAKGLWGPSPTDLNKFAASPSIINGPGGGVLSKAGKLQALRSSKLEAPSPPQGGGGGGSAPGIYRGSKFV